MCFYIISIPVRFTNTYLFVMALMRNMHGYPQCYIWSRKNNTEILNGQMSCRINAIIISAFLLFSCPSIFLNHFPHLLFSFNTQEF